MKNKEITLENMYALIRSGYISMFPYGFEGYLEMLTHTFNQDIEKTGLPITFYISDDYHNDNDLNLVKHIRIEPIIEKLELLSANVKEDTNKLISRLNNDINNIINDFNSLHSWLIREGLIIKEERKFDSPIYFMTKSFMDLKKLPL
ncbi:hypothetical protein NA898_03260 [Proteus cibi]|uniref:Uncharacterized protein n=1 Tax=Proteus cibi TaxID=2050966 RepID=A0ABU6EEH7_9GAMM|nr:hypothetical protein [Proteus cibi]MEB6856435.1 hypothetical protein [Proteus cibi]MEB7087572.1 hypothetical protein [Proteus cibi]